MMLRIGKIKPNLRGFLLIELLVTIAILSTGLVVILAGFNSSLNALGATRDIITASRILEDKIRILEQQESEQDGISAEEKEEEIDNFNLMHTVTPLKETAIPIDEGALWDEDIAPYKDTVLSEVKLKLSWPDGTKERELELVTYMRSKKIEAEEEWQ